ncbi:hypothetical protein D3C81_1818850 [compost metagenome]
MSRDNAEGNQLAVGGMRQGCMDACMEGRHIQDQVIRGQHQQDWIVPLSHSLQSC